VLRLQAVARATLPAIQRVGPVEVLSLAQLKDLLGQAAEDQDSRILLLDKAARVSFDSEGRWEGQNLLDFSRRSTLRPDQIMGKFAAPSGGGWIFVGEIVRGPRGERLIILFVSPQGRLLLLAWFVENLMPPLARAGAVALVLSVLLALLISRSVAAPLKRVASAAKAIAGGETEARAPASGPQELRELAQAFNEMADQVEASQQSQRDFVANVSHELKTPLTAIQGFSQALLDGTASGPEAAARAARVIHEEADRMRRLADELLTLARFDAGQVEMACGPIDLGPILQRCIEKLATQAEAAGVSVALDPPGMLPVTGDGDRLVQVFTNLLANAIAHTPAGGNVSLRARQMEDGGVAVAVTDTGEGIPPKALPRIFERFYRADKARQRGRGAGLGLAITKEIVEAHGGTVVAESVLGLGSKFTVQLPP
jgi:signal transduction histidine kinase